MHLNLYYVEFENIPSLISFALLDTRSLYYVVSSHRLLLLIFFFHLIFHTSSQTGFKLIPIGYIYSLFDGNIFVKEKNRGVSRCNKSIKYLVTYNIIMICYNSERSQCKS